MLERFEQADVANLLDAAQSFLEFAWILPDSALAKVMETLVQSESLPMDNEFDEWLDSQDTLQAELEDVLSQEREAKRNLLLGYLRYPARMARNYIGQGVDYLDLVQEGVLGLLRAVDRYDYREHGRFVHYATTWIWQRLERAAKSYGRTIRIPVHFHEFLDRIAQAYLRAVDEGIEMPCAGELALRAGLMSPEDSEEIRSATSSEEIRPDVKKRWIDVVERVRLALSYLWPMHSLDEGTPFDGDREAIPSLLQTGDQASLSDVIPASSTAIPDECFERQEVVRCVREAVESLPTRRRDREIVKLRFGMQDGQMHTLEEVGERYDLTRERIRQIETRTLDQLASAVENQLLVGHSRQLNLSLAPALFDHLAHKDRDYLLHESMCRGGQKDDRFPILDECLAQLPSGTAFGRHYGGEARREQLERILRDFQQPAHYADIAQEIGEQSPDVSVSPNYIYSLLAQCNDTFILLGEGVFSLVSWERARRQDDEPVVPYCGAPLLDATGKAYSFFESVMVARQWLDKGLPADTFLDRIASWAGFENDVAEWLQQSYLTAYYIVGLIPYAFLPDEPNQMLRCTLLGDDIRDARLHCLQTMNRRLVAMPAFWWLLRLHQPTRVTQLGERLSEVHPAGLDDVSQRLTILVSLGAVVEESGQYRLTQLGDDCAETWAVRPDVPAKLELPEKPTPDSEPWLDIGCFL
jgi:RNA polymerase primary sigma factor